MKLVGQVKSATAILDAGKSFVDLVVRVSANSSKRDSRKPDGDTKVRVEDLLKLERAGVQIIGVKDPDPFGGTVVVGGGGGDGGSVPPSDGADGEGGQAAAPPATAGDASVTTIPKGKKGAKK